MYALVDCNNFFVSCERAFQPELEGKPVVVLSNNDGCVVARSNESKAMGIKMGTPFFQVRNLSDSGKLIVKSSNYVLYGDLSRRVMSILREAAPRLEVYSIDEAFMDLEGVQPEQYRPMCLALVRKIRLWTGIPVSIGIAPTKTLAKVANHFAKRYPGYRGVCTIDNDEKREKALSLSPVGDIWGIGRRVAPKLEAMGIRTALDFARMPREWVKGKLGVMGERTWMELCGQEAVEREEWEARKTICTSRSFADPIPDLDELSLRVSDFAAICARKLRKEHTAAGRVTVFMYTNRFREDLPQYFPAISVPLDVPANNNQEIVGAALRGLKAIFKEGYGYKKAGVIVDDIIPESQIQGSLFDDNTEMRERENVISELMDRFNTSDRSLLRLASQRPGHYAEGIRRDHCSKLFSTSWDELIEVH
ncbi:MAG: SOS mutagenesis and repair protein UmuC [Bacteroidales bacterium]|nr:SOS mutagenesis and repair protein UmuC [Bacteroidales bacterium]